MNQKAPIANDGFLAIEIYRRKKKPLFYTQVNKRETGAQAKPSLLIMLMISLVALFSVGCGSSSEDFVVTGNNNNNNPGAGTLTFQFAKAQNVATVPNSTVSIRFEYLDAAGAVIDEEVRPFATEITVTPPDGMVSVRITPLDADGFPVVNAVGPATTPPLGTNQVADMSAFNFTVVTLETLTVTPDPVSVTAGTQTGNTQQLTLTGLFDNDDLVQFPAAAVAEATFTETSDFFNVSATGLVSAVAAGTGTVLVSYTYGEDTRTDTVTVNVTGGVIPVDTFVVTPDPLSVGVGATSDPVVVSFTPAGGTTLTVPNNEVTFTTDNAGFTPNANGTVTVATSVAPNTSATLTATWTDDDDDVNTDTITVTAVNNSAFLNPAGATLTLPWDLFEYQTSVVRNGAFVNDLFTNGYTFSSSDPDVATITSGGLLTTDEEGTATISLLLNGVVVDSFVLTTVDVNITSFVVNPDEFDLTPGRTLPYTVIATYSNNTTADISGTTELYVDDIFGSANDAGFFAGRVTGGERLGEGTIYELGIGNVYENVTVNQAAGFIDAYNVNVGGLASGNIPENLLAAVDVFATLDTGEVIRLRPDQFNLFEVSDPSDGFYSYDNFIDDDGYDVGDAATYAVTIDSDFVSSVNATREFNVQVVDNAQGQVSASFTNYTDDPVMFESISRPITVLFSNANVQGFKVTDEDATVRDSVDFFSGRTDSDIWGFPALRAWNDGFEGNLTIEVETNNGEIVGAGTMDVRVWEWDEVYFDPSTLILNPGETKEARLIVLGHRDNEAAQQFSRALDFAYPSFSNDDGIFARRGNDCRVTGIIPGTDGDVEARDVCDLDFFASLHVIVNPPSNNE